MERILAKDSSILESENFFPKRSQYNTTGRRLDLAANYFRFSFINQNKKIFFKYAVNFDPELPGDSGRLRNKIFHKAKEELTKMLGHYIFNNTTLYSLEQNQDLMEVTVEFDSQKYLITIKLTNFIEADSFEAESLYKKFFNVLLKKINFIQIRKNFFDASAAKFLKNQEKLEVWPGFNSSVNILQEGILLNMNLVYRVLRPQTAHDQIKTLSQNMRNKEEMRENFNLYFKGMAVLTRYNNDKVYIIDEVDVEMTPKSTFDTKDGPISYLEYYKTKYGLKINNQDQPLLVHKDKKKDQIIHLIPEFCYLSGLTDDMRANFNLMKELSVITKGNAAEKLEECRNLINQFNNNKGCQEVMNNWGLTLSNKPIELNGTKISAGLCLMHKKQDGNRYSFPIDESPDIDRKIQAEMFSQPVLNTWAIFCTQKDQNLANTFMDTMKQVQSTFNYQMSKPAVFFVKSQYYNDWEAELAKNLNPSVQAVVLIIPGQRGKGQLYNDVKKLLMGKFPVPSQVVLSGTISKGKGVRSIVNKILIQICAKVGGEPWAVDGMPFTNCPTMVCGVDVFNGAGKKSILGFTATYNRMFTRYISLAKVVEDGNQNQLISECMKEAIQNFTSVNKVSPQHIIVIRDGVAPSQVRTVCVPEVNIIKEVIQNTKLNCKVTYTLLNKKTNLKIFMLDNKSVVNAPTGTIIDTKVTSGEFNDFYLIPAKSNQGLASSIHYQIIYDDAKIVDSEFHSFIYKLCFLYYNWTGSIKVPAPCQYAKKLASLLGDKLSDKKNVYLPNNRFNQQLKSLYYL